MTILRILCAFLLSLIAIMFSVIATPFILVASAAAVASHRVMGRRK